MKKSGWKMSIIGSVLATAVLIWLLTPSVPARLGLSEPSGESRTDRVNIYNSGGSSVPGGITPQANAAMDGLFVKFEGVVGESADAGFEGWSRAINFGQGQLLPDMGTSIIRVRGDAVSEPFVIVKELDKAGPKLAEAVYNAKFFSKVEVLLTTAQGGGGLVTYYSYELRNVLVISYHIGANEYGGSRPVETISLTFGEIRVRYNEYDASGRPKGSVEYSFRAEG